MELPCWNSPWPRGAVLQCPGTLHYLYMFLQLFAFFAFHIYFWPYIFAHFGNRNLYIVIKLNFTERQFSIDYRLLEPVGSYIHKEERQHTGVDMYRNVDLHVTRK